MLKLTIQMVYGFETAREGNPHQEAEEEPVCEWKRSVTRAKPLLHICFCVDVNAAS